MDFSFSSGNETVDRVGQIDFSLCGSVNLLPDTWYKTMTYDNGKPNMNACLILSEIVYWYKPQIIKNEFTGEITAVKPKFKADLLQRSRKSFEAKFGLTEKQVKDALYFLENKIGVIRRERRNVISDTDISLGNVLFIDLDVDKLIEITYPKNLRNAENTEDSTLRTSKSQGGDSEVKSQGRDIEVPRVGHTSTKVGTPKSQGKDIKVPTYTYTTTKTSTEITTSSPSRDSEKGLSGAEEEKAYRKLIADNISLDDLLAMAETESVKERINMLYEIMCKTVNSKAKTIRINSENMPANVVRSQFLKLTDKEITYVCDVLDNPPENPIGNLEGYIKTLLYNSPNLAGEYWTQKVAYNEHGGGKKKPEKKSGFNNFEQRDIDFDELERRLVRN